MSQSIEVPTLHVSLDDTLSRIGDGWFQTRLTWVCGLGFSAAAVEIVLTGFAFTELRGVWSLSEHELSVVPMLVGIGSILGELCWGPIADYFGRARVFLATTIVVCVFGIASAMAPDIWWFTVLRTLVGFGYGGNISVDYALFSEFLPLETRGLSLFKMAFFWPLGQFVTCLLAMHVIPYFGWRWFVAACACPAICTAFLRPFIPESPRWLLLHGQPAAATEVCKHIAEVNGRSLKEVGLTEGVQVSLKEGEALQPQSLSRSFAETSRLFSPALLSTTMGAILFTVALNGAGYGVSTLMPTLLELKGIEQGAMYETMVVNTLAQFPGIALGLALGIAIGRLIPLRLALVGITCSLCLFAFATTKAHVVLATSLCNLFLESGWSLIHVYLPEVYPTELRATAIGANSAIASILTFFVPLIAAHILDAQAHDGTHGAWGTIVFFTVFGLLGIMGAFVCLDIETKDRDLEDRMSKRKI
mmetsp:Transcript_19052/g.34473  ORF Transcript_19052/g.34473 Transcript_19052/m.34473 type:complete len:475 (+) Transcript_19052:112-1536(+)